MRVAVVGGGLLGSLVALSAAARGWEVELLDARSELLSAASSVNEGKIHLGLIFALGDSATQELMLRGALSFAPLLDSAIGAPVDWHELSSAPFEYLVMPSSLLNATELADQYSGMNDRFDSVSQRWGSRYLGNDIDRLADTEWREDPATGLPSFVTTERAVDPVRLGAVVKSRLSSTPNITTHVSRRVLALDAKPSGVDVSWSDTRGRPTSDRYDFVVNCTWENQLALAPNPEHGGRNFRLKTAVRLPNVAGARTVTLAQGPFGDVVVHRDYTYASWYPDARLTNEYATSPSTATLHLLDQIEAPVVDDAPAADQRDSLALRQLEALQRVGVLPEVVGEGQLIGGIIVGHGPLDIDHAESKLHSRAEFGAHVAGRVVSPRNFKLTTAPLAATQAIEAIESVLGRTVLA